MPPVREPIREAGSRRLALIALLAGATGIGFAPVLVRQSEVGPSATAFFRLLFALPFLWVWMRREQTNASPSQPPATHRDFLLLAAAGLFFTGDLSIWHWSLQFTSVANSTVLTNFAPIFVTLGAWAVFRERISSVFVAGMIVALAGAALLVGADFTMSTDHLLGDGLSLVAAVFYAGYLLTVKHLRRSFSTATIMAWSGLVSCPAFLVVALLSGEQVQPASLSGWMVLLALALICHVGGQTFIAYALGHLPASFSALSLLWQPIVAAVLAWMLLSEPLTLIQGIGGLVVLIGIAIGSRNSR